MEKKENSERSECKSKVTIERVCKSLAGKSINLTRELRDDVETAWKIVKIIVFKCHRSG